MAPGGPSPTGGRAGEVFQNTDPFQNDEVQQERENGISQLETSQTRARTDSNLEKLPTAEDDADGLRLAGVRSLDPWESDRKASESRVARESNLARGNSAGEDPALLARRDQETLNRVISSNGDKNSALERVPTGSDWPVADYEDVSPGAGAGSHESRGALSPVAEDVGPGDGAASATTDAHDYFPNTHKISNNNAEPETDPQASDYDITHDHGARGTDVFAIVDPDWPEDEKWKASPDSSDSSQRKDRKPRVGFADQNNKHNSSGSNSDDPDHDVGIVEKLTTKAKDAGYQLQSIDVGGPLKKMNPTNVKMRVRYGSLGNNNFPDKEVGIIWRSRDNRKGRNSVVVPRTAMAYPNLPPKNRPVYSSSFQGVIRNLFRMCFSFPYWDMAFWSGWSYTWGSVLFVIDGVWAWGPTGHDYGAWAKVEWKYAEEYAIGIFFFIGALLYQVGAVMAYLEAVNDGSFHGTAMKRFLEGHEEEKKKMLDDKVSSFLGHLNPKHEKRKHAEEKEEMERMSSVDPDAGWKTIHRRERYGSVYPDHQNPAPRRGGIDLGEAEEGESHDYLTWRWYPTWYALKTHHRFEIGYIACSIQLFGATLYSWCGLVSVPKLNDNWTDAKFYGGYWFPEIFGSCCFLSASFMFIFETQERWWKPQPNVMGWWIGIWAMIGSWGFLTNGIFGVLAQYATAAAKEAAEEHVHLHWEGVAIWAEFAAEACTTWGSFGYLCSALCQWYEAVNKHPVEELFSEPGDMKSWQIHPA